jgi:hypothetical protein
MHIMNAYTLVMLSVLALSTAQAPSTKPVWAVQFDAPFGMYAPENAFGSGLPAIINATSHFYYKWTGIKATLIDYPRQCLPVKPFVCYMKLIYLIYLISFVRLFSLLIVINLLWCCRSICILLSLSARPRALASSSSCRPGRGSTTRP